MSPARLFPSAAALASVLLIAALAVYGGFTVGTGYWTYPFAVDALLHVGVLAALAMVLRLAVPERALVMLVVISTVYVLIGIGVAQCLAALLFFAASLLLGTQLLTFMFPSQQQVPSAALICGTATYLTIFGIMIHFPVNYRALYLVMLAAPFAVEAVAGRGVSRWNEMTSHVNAYREAARRLPYAGVAAGSITAVLIARFAFLPTLGYDDNALHLGMWSQLRHEHIYGFDVTVQVWEVAPFAVDLLHAVVNLAAGADARGATNLVLLTVLLRQLWIMAGHLQLDAGKRSLLLALFVSTPMVGYLLMSMQTELFMALLATAGVRLVLELRGDWCGPTAAAMLGIAALCCAAKLPGAWLGILLLIAAAQLLWSTRQLAPAVRTRSIVLLGAFTLLLTLLAFNAYVNAWLTTGNPVFPLYNAIFQSPYFRPDNFTDARWTQGFSLASYWNMFFNTSAYYESFNFVAGFQYLLLLPLGMTAMLATRALRQYAFVLLVPLLGFGIVMFGALQYWRYLFPVLPLATVVIGALFIRSSSRGERLVSGSVLLCIALNLCFYPGITGLMSVAPTQAYTAGGKQRTVEQFTAARALTDWINTHAPGSHVLYPESVPYGATLHGKPVYPNWYAPATDARFHAIRDEAEGRAFLRDMGIEYVVAWIEAPAPSGTAGWDLRRFLGRVAEPVLQVNDHILYRMTGTDVPYAQKYALEEPRTVDANPTRIARVAIDTATAVRYRAEFACGAETGYFVAQISWNSGHYYYHRVPCASGPLQFVEAIPVPAGATSGDIYVYVSETASATLTQLSLETH